MVARDSSGNGHNGAYDASVIFNETSPVQDGNAAVGFTTTGVTVPHASDWFSASFTMEFWGILPDSGTLSWNVGTVGPQLSVSTATIDGFIPNAAAGKWIEATGTGPALGESFYVVMRYDGATGDLSLWLDGTLIGDSTTTTGTRAVDDSVSTSIIAGTHGSVCAHQAWYDKALGDARIMTHASVGSAGAFNPGGGTTGGGGTGGGGTPGTPAHWLTINPPQGVVGTAYSYQFQASGDPTLVYTFNSGTVPPGLTFHTATAIIDGTPTGAGTFTFEIGVSNTTGGSAASVSLDVIPSGTGGGGGGGGTPPIMTASNPPDGTVGTAYTYTFAASGTTPITWSIDAGTIPNGLSFNDTTGVLSGTPTVSASFTFVVTATNLFGTSTVDCQMLVNLASTGGGGGGGGTTITRGSPWLFPFQGGQNRTGTDPACCVFNMPLGAGCTFDSRTVPSGGRVFVNSYFFGITVAGNVGYTSTAQKDNVENHTAVISNDRLSDQEFFGFPAGGPGAPYFISPVALNAGGNIQNNFGASGMAVLGGLIRWADIQQGAINHALHVWVPQTTCFNGFVWPATRVDSDHSGYTGFVPMGGTLAIPQADTKPAGLSNLSSLIYDALKNYGCIIRDTTGNPGNGTTFAIEAFAFDNGVTVNETELGTIYSRVRWVTNQTPDGTNNNALRPLGGPGARVAPYLDII